MLFINSIPDSVKVVELVDTLMETYHLTRRCEIDIDHKIVIWFDKLEFITKRSLLKSCDGRGETYTEACMDLVKKLHATKYNIRINGGYHTNDVKELVDKVYINKEWVTLYFFLFMKGW